MKKKVNKTNDQEMINEVVAKKAEKKTLNVGKKGLGILSRIKDSLVRHSKDIRFGLGLTALGLGTYIIGAKVGYELHSEEYDKAWSALVKENPQLKEELAKTLSKVVNDKVMKMGENEAV